MNYLEIFNIGFYFWKAAKNRLLKLNKKIKKRNFYVSLIHGFLRLFLDDPPRVELETRL